MSVSTTLIEGLYFGEGPRWHDGRLWFSDFYDQAVKSIDGSGELRVEHRIDDIPSGLGWLPDGRLLVVAMRNMQLLRQEGDGFVVHADLSGLSAHRCNDMVVDRKGRAYVGNFGFDLDSAIHEHGAESVIMDHPRANLVRVDPDGSVHCAAADMSFPNGAVITADGATLIVAESLALRLTAFDIAPDGALSNRREWAQVGQRAPDGICLDENGCVWFANALAPECLLMAEGGEIVDTVETSQNCYACMLGGADGKDLFLMTAQFSSGDAASMARTGKVEVARASAARAAGCP
jgi:sugar lactone lactonase YvrE